MLTLKHCILVIWYVLAFYNNVALSSGLSGSEEDPDDFHEHYANEWVARIYGGPEVADRVARDHGYTNLGQLIGFEDTYTLAKSDVPTRSKRDASHYTEKLSLDGRVEWADQQQIKRRVKRGILESDFIKNLLIKNKCNDDQFIDPMWQYQWYMCDRRTQANLPIIDLNVAGAWKYGITGKGVVLSILDDGLEWNHTDIFSNYDPEASWDVNDDDPDPFPKYDFINSNKHGTRCAGEIAMVANNTICGVGVAYNSKVGGVRMLDGIVTDSVEAVSIGFNCTHIDIYSASWGPTDNGETLDGPGRLTSETIHRCIKEGRGGKGVIYVWASGNGGLKDDNCNCDGYNTNMYTVSIGSVSQSGSFPYYGELCASTIACAYSGGAYTDQKINTIDLHNKCANDHTGTSAAAPLGAGIIALMLEANQNLTWRDVQHIIVFTSEFGPVANNPGWQVNGIGLPVNLRFGFGLMNAESSVDAAINWVNVPEKCVCRVEPLKKYNHELQSPGSIQVLFDGSLCERNDSTHVNYIEHVQVLFSMKHSRRGALSVDLTSPNGTRSTLLNPRINDNSPNGFKNWTFMTLHTWGESPKGIWSLIVTDTSYEGNVGELIETTLIVHGTSEMPNHMSGHFAFKNERTRSTSRENSDVPESDTSYWARSAKHIKAAFNYLFGE